MAILVDDCWPEVTGRVNNHLAPNMTRFPDGIDGLAKKIHDMKLKFGIYSSELNLCIFLKIDLPLKNTAQMLRPRLVLAILPVLALRTLMLQILPNGELIVSEHRNLPQFLHVTTRVNIICFTDLK